MQYRCAQCHHSFTAEGEAEQCPNCKAEAGLEPVHGIPLPMKLFGFLLGGAIFASVAGGVASRIVGT